MERARRQQNGRSITQAARDVDRGVSNHEASDKLAVQQQASQAVSGGGGDLPFLSELSTAFGQDLSGLSAHVGGGTAEICASMDAAGFAYGNDIAFQSSPDLWTAAHEAAHCLHQQAGTGVAGGVGRQGDTGEQAADAVADRVVSGRSAADLLPDQAQVQGSGGVKAVQFYKDERQEDGTVLRYSDDGEMIVGQYNHTYDDGSEYQGGSHNFYTRDDAGDWNDGLDDAGSVIDLDVGPEIQDGYGQVSATNTSTGTSGDDMTIWADCGRSARDVTGAGAGTGGNHNGRMTAVYNTQRDASFLEKVGNVFSTGAWDSDLQITEEHETRASNPQAMKEEILSTLLGGTPEEAIAKYEAMSPEERRAFDTRAGINRAAAPQVGEGYTMASHGASLPVENEKDAMHDNDGDGMVDQWNFHWAGVVARSGGDTVSLENYATGVADEKNADWEHQMYGSADGQTFWDAHKDTKQHGDSPFAFRVRRTDN